MNCTECHCESTELNFGVCEACARGQRVPVDEGRKHDQQKPRPSLLPPDALREVIDVLEFGAKKYSPDNWRRVPDAKQRYTDAMLRHALAILSGETHDPETGLQHAAHVACCSMFLCELGEPAVVNDSSTWINPRLLEQ